MIRALEGVRVLDWADERGVFASRVLADLGADVVRVEPPDGGRVRRLHPFVGDTPHPERSCYHLYHNANKRSVCLDGRDPQGAELLRRLIASSRIVIETEAPGALEVRGLGPAALRGLRADLIQVSITPFGLSGPWAGRKANDLVAAAAGGLLHVSGSRVDPPAQAGADPTYKLASLAAAAGALIALHARAEDGSSPPAHLDISLQESVALALAQTANANYYAWHGRVPGRPGLTAVHRCADGGWVTVILRPERQDALFEWLDEAGLSAGATARALQGPGLRELAHGHVRRLVDRYPREEFLRRAWQLGILALPAQSLPEMQTCEQFTATEQFRELKHDPLDVSLSFPRSPVDCLEGGASLRRAPLLGEHTEELRRELGLAASPDGRDERGTARRS